MSNDLGRTARQGHRGLSNGEVRRGNNYSIVEKTAFGYAWDLIRGRSVAGVKRK